MHKSRAELFTYLFEVHEEALWNPLKQALALVGMHRGLLPIRTLAAYLNISTSQFERSFAAQLGTTPKHFARMIRFYGTVLHLHQQKVHPLADLAIQHGYVDQAHFTHEFVEFAGLTPSEFLRVIPDADFLEDKSETYH